jgi:RNA recognition motif-containing protein
LEDFFKDCGAIIKSRIIRDRDTGKPKGFGYVDFTDYASVKEAIKLSGSELDGR